jgi:hypothetical protein
MRDRRQMLIAEGTTACLAIVASLCVTDTAKADISSGPGWMGAVITLNNVKVTSMTSSDAIIIPYKERMTKLCSVGHCIFYKGYCGKGDGKFSCNIWYSFEEATELRRIKMRGKRVFILSAMDRLRVVMSPDIMIPLSTFRYDAQDDSPPACYARQGCTAD